MHGGAPTVTTRRYIPRKGIFCYRMPGSESLSSAQHADTACCLGQRAWQRCRTEKTNQVLCAAPWGLEVLAPWRGSNKLRVGSFLRTKSCFRLNFFFFCKVIYRLICCVIIHLVCYKSAVVLFIYVSCL